MVQFTDYAKSGTYRHYDFRRKIVFETTVRDNEDGTQTWNVSEIWLGLGKSGTKYSHEEIVDTQGKHTIVEPKGKERIGVKLARDNKGIISVFGALDSAESTRYNELFESAHDRNKKYSQERVEHEFSGANEDEAIVRKMETVAVDGGFKRVVTEYNLGDGYKKAYKHIEWLNEDGDVIERDLPLSGKLLGKDVAHKTKNPTVDARIDYDSQGNESKVQYMTDGEANHFQRMWDHWKEEQKPAPVPEKPSWFKRNFPWLSNVIKKIGDRLKQKTPVDSEASGRRPTGNEGKRQGDPSRLLNKVRGAQAKSRNETGNKGAQKDLRKTLSLDAKAAALDEYSKNERDNRKRLVAEALKAGKPLSVEEVFKLRKAEAEKRAEKNRLLHGLPARRKGR